MRTAWSGSVVGVVLSAVLGAALLPIRAHLDVATSALVLVVPVTAGAYIGGFAAGLVSVGSGFLVYDIFFIPPYGTLRVGAAQNWIALGVYVVVMVLVARLVAKLEKTRAALAVKEANARRLFEVSELFAVERTLADVGSTIVTAIRRNFGFSGVVLMVPAEGGLDVLARAGEPIADDELARVRRSPQVPVHLSTGGPGQAVHILALCASGPPVGLLAISGVSTEPAWRELLLTIANQAAVALERAQLRERALRTEVLEEVDRLRQGLVGAVSHDLRTPLATIKVAATTLIEEGHRLGDSDTRELFELIDVEADRLSRLVSSLLDMSRLEAGVLSVTKERCKAGDLLRATVDTMRHHGTHRIDVEVAPGLADVDADPVLVRQVLANLLDNAQRHAPDGTPIAVAAAPGGPGVIEISVTDRGSGIPQHERRSVFESFVGFDTGGRAGLGLALAKAFVEAHNGRIWVEEASGGGARFVFTLLVTSAEAAVP